jgi:putative Ig domain-containing protein/IPT/TIG domain-containing protein
MAKFKHCIVSAILLLLVPVLAPAQKSLPVLSSFSPTSTTAGVGVTLTVNGSNFSSGSVVLWNGTVQPTTYVNKTKLTALISSALVGTAGTATVAVYTTGKFGGQSNSLTFTVLASGSSGGTTPSTPLTITTTSLPGGTAGTAYSASLSASGGTAPYVWSLGSGSSLPAGLALASSGGISGTPTISGSFSFTAQVKDSANASTSYTYSLTIGASATLSCGSGLTGCPLSAPTACYNLQTDTNNCGSCGTVCGLTANVLTTACTAGVCTATACSAGFADCNHVYSDGCETNLLTSNNNCGACGNVCPQTSNATESCVSGSCAVTTCSAGYGDCNHLASDGCETNLLTSNSNCGACGNACAAGQSCTNGSCI